MKMVLDYKKTFLYSKIVVGETIRKRRKELGWTQEQLAHEAGVCARNISRIENGERFPTIATLYMLRKALNMEQDPLMVLVMEIAEQMADYD